MRKNSNTSRHLAEFWMVEPELAFADLNDDMDCARLTSSIASTTCSKTATKISHSSRRIFQRITCVSVFVAWPRKSRLLRSRTPLVDHILNAKKKFEFPIKWGADLQSEHERYITEEVFKNRPVIVRDYPKDIKAFYMRLNDDNKTVAAMDVRPRVGES